METIPHRELRNNSSAILARVKNGETIAITNHGELVAVISPPSLSPLDQARLLGQVREARPGAPRLDQIERIKSDLTTEEILADLRGDR